MPTASKSSAKSKSRRAPPRSARDPLSIKLLKEDHRQVEAWFEEYEELEDENEKRDLAGKITLALKVHTQIEEEIFYPAAEGAVDDDMMDEALVEHDGAKKLIAEIERMKPSQELYDAKVKVLSEYIKHHVKEEEQPDGMFAQFKKSDEDLDALGEKLKKRKEELMQKLAPKSH